MAQLMTLLDTGIFIMRFSRYLAACMLVCFPLFVHAQDQIELQKLQADSAFARNLISESKLEIQKYQAKLDKLREEGVIAAQTLELSKSELNKVKALFSADETPANKRALDRAESSVVLAERKLSSLEKRMMFSSKRIEELQSQVDSSESKIAANSRREEQLNEEIEIQRLAKQQAELRTKEAQREKLQADQAQQIELSRQAEERANAAKQAAAKKIEAEKKALNQAETKPSIQLSEEDALERTRGQAVVRELEAYIASGVRERGEYSRLTGYSSSNGKFQMKHLGGEIYVGETELDAGEHRVSIRASTYRVVISEADNGELFTIYYDNRDKYKKKLYSFKSLLLKE